MKRFAVFYSGYGRGAKEIINDYNNGYIIPQLSLVFTTKPNTEAFKLAKELGIPAYSLDRRAYNSRNDFEVDLINLLISYNIDYIFLAGYGLIIGELLLKEYANRIVNIHPSLLPSFAGTKTAIQDAMNYGVKIVGITTHIVDEGIDTGKILFQDSFPITDITDFNFIEYQMFKRGTILQVETINKYFI
jgi:phosphoribosylglycinamide formyltransferase-1